MAVGSDLTPMALAGEDALRHYFGGLVGLGSRSTAAAGSGGEDLRLLLLELRVVENTLLAELPELLELLELHIRATGSRRRRLGRLLVGLLLLVGLGLVLLRPPTRLPT